MSIKERILKHKRSLSGVNIMDLTRDGEFSMFTKLESKEPRDLTLTSVSISIDHSISDQDSQ
jgi:hypothetical protein